MANLNKKTQVNSLSLSLQKNTNIVLISLGIVTHQSFEKLRRDLKKSGTSLKVIKNSLFEKAINKIGSSNKIYLDFKKKFLPLRDSSAMITFSDDWSEGLHTFFDFLQKEKSLKFKSGILDSQLYSEEEILRIAKLPNKLQLISTIIGSLKNPASRLTYSLKFNTNKFVYILKSKSKAN